jgi:hypothetical protein
MQTLLPLLSGDSLPPLPALAQFVSFVAHLVFLALLSLLLPRSWFIALFKIAFPFMPERVEDFDG